MMSDNIECGSDADKLAGSSAFAGDPGGYSDQEWETAAERVGAARRRLADNPAAARAENETYAGIHTRVETLRAIRRARGLTQSQISAQLEISQAEVSRMERRNNLHLTTLARFVDAIGGRLRITAVFDDREVEIGVGDLFPTGD